MSRLVRVVLVLLAGVALIALVVWRRPPDAPVLAAPNVFSGPINGGCYLATTMTCSIHVDQWQPIVIDNGQKLIGFQLAAKVADSGLVTLYDFRTDVSNPPSGSYLPSLVRQDFVAQCGASYRLTLLAKDTGDADFEETGHTDMFTCPEVLITPTPTATATATATATPTPTATPEGTPMPPGKAIYLPVILGDP